MNLYIAKHSHKTQKYIREAIEIADRQGFIL